jgi:hypothetical protein
MIYLNTKDRKGSTKIIKDFFDNPVKENKMINKK